MHHMKTIKIFALMALACVLLTSSAYASVITQTCIIPVTGVPYTQNCVMNQFNQPTAGTLTSVSLSLTNVSGNVIPEQTNISATTLTFINSVATIGLTLTGPDSVFVTQASTDRKSTRLNSSHRCISYAVFCLKQ